MKGCNIYVVFFSSHYNFKVANACMLGFCSPELNLDVIEYFCSPESLTISRLFHIPRIFLAKTHTIRFRYQHLLYTLPYHRAKVDTKSSTGPHPQKLE
jgi:hypothetical protein